MPSTRQLICLTLSTLVLSACSKKAGPVTQSQDAAQTAAAQTPQPQQKPTNACAMVTAAEMSKILGSTVTSANPGTSNETECIYKGASGVSPYVELAVVRGDGEAAMMASGFMGQREPGIASPYDGIGDQAFAIGPVLMIRAGEDLVKLTLSGVADGPSRAKQIFDTLQPRL